jgi:hypothetical protein
LAADPRFEVTESIENMRRHANDLLDSFVDASWLEWAEPAGLMPATLKKVKDDAEESARRKAAAADQRRLENKRREQERKKRKRAKKVAEGSTKSTRATMARKASKSSGFGEDLSMSESEPSGGVIRTRLSKSEVGLREANAAWVVIQQGSAPASYNLVSVFSPSHP